MNDKKIFFSEIKQGRDKYFVEYRPPIRGFQFASLQLIYLGEISHGKIADDMELEARVWTQRFDVPIMVSAFDAAGDVIDMREVRTERSLMAFNCPNSGQLMLHWRLLNNEEVPSIALSIEYLLRVYKEVPYRTSEEVRLSAEKKAKQIQLGRGIIVFWAVIVPAVVLVLEFFSPQWIAILVLTYGLLKAVVKWLKMTGRWKHSKAELEDAERQRLKEHYYFHCERNADAFNRLKFENFERESREAIQKEASQIAKVSL